MHIVCMCACKSRGKQMYLSEQMYLMLSRRKRIPYSYTTLRHHIYQTPERAYFILASECYDLHTNAIADPSAHLKPSTPVKPKVIRDSSLICKGEGLVPAGLPRLQAVGQALDLQLRKP